MRKLAILGFVVGILVAMIVSPITAQDAFTSLNPAQIYQTISPSVVAINIAANGRGGGGSGFVIDTQGHIVTNNHVAEGATFIEIEFFDGMLAEAQIVGLDPDSDIAVVKVDVPSNQLRPITFGNSSALTIGEPVLAIGSPYGQDWTLTTGIVSGTNRVIQGQTSFSIGGVIQTDAAINPGNSGGPLLNQQGQVIGVNSQIISGSGSSSGVGFAVPGNLVQRVASELIANNRVQYSYIGISGTDVTLNMLRSLNLTQNVRGVFVSDTVNGGPAAVAGLQAAIGTNNTISGYDIITAVNGLPIEGMDDLISYLALNTVPGDTVTLNILRNGTQSFSLPIVLAPRPSV